MKKGSGLKVVVAILFVVVAVLWLLSVLMPETFGNINLAFIIAGFCAILAIALFIKAITVKLSMMKKFNILFGIIFLVAAVLALVGQFIAKQLALPIIAVVVTVGGLVGLFITGGKSYDTADNEKAGYKTYRERKAEEEKAEAKAAKEDKE